MNFIFFSLLRLYNWLGNLFRPKPKDSPFKMKIFLGWDSREANAYDVARYSIIHNSKYPDIRVIPIELKNLGELLTRPIERREGKLWCPISQAYMATEFAISRFCVPFLAKKGWALFADADIVCQADIQKLFALRDKKYAVMVVKHKQETGTAVKMDGQVQTYYSRKNWSSVVLWNCDHPSNQKLTAEMLNTLPGRDLHAFCWLADDEIGELPREWNYLVGIDTYPISTAKIIHYTLGGPWFTEWSWHEADIYWNNMYAKVRSNVPPEFNRQKK